MIDIHRALDGVAAQVQGTDIAFFGNADFGQMRLGRAQAAVRMAGRHGQRRKDIKGVILTENDDVLRCGGFQTAFEYVGLEDKAYI
jgi:cytosolic beta-glucosidase